MTAAKEQIDLRRNGPATAKKGEEQIRILPLRQAILTVPVVGQTPLKILRFSKKKQDQVAATQAQGDQAKTKRKRDAKNFAQEYEEAKYYCDTREGGKKVRWLGLNASGVRNGCIETCRVAGYVMTKAKMSIFCNEDGLDSLDATPLVRVYGEPEMSVDPVRNASGVIDLRPRPEARVSQGDGLQWMGWNEESGRESIEAN